MAIFALPPHITMLPQQIENIAFERRWENKKVKIKHFVIYHYVCSSQYLSANKPMCWCISIPFHVGFPLLRLGVEEPSHQKRTSYKIRKHVLLE